MDPKPVPSVETSLKFMAWDHKKMGEYVFKIADSLNCISATLTDLNNQIAKIAGQLKSKPQKEVDSDTIPF